MAASDQLVHPDIRVCRHQPPCPAADAIDHAAARMISTHPEQGWSLLCNGVIAFDDTGDLLPDGTPVQPQQIPPHLPRSSVRELTYA
jgi:hypothetical protein